MEKVFGSSILMASIISLILTAVYQAHAFALSSSAIQYKNAFDPNDFENSTVFSGETCDYIQHVPPSYNGSKAVPLVIVLHPRGSSSSGIEKTSNMSSKADEEGFIAAYPDGTGNPRARNPGFYPLNPTSSDDVAFKGALIDKLGKDLHLDGIGSIYADSRMVRS